MNVKEWFPVWDKNDIAIVVASGPSAKDVGLEQFKDQAKFIAVNNSWELAPWADVLFAADCRWWQLYKGVPEFKGMKITLDQLAAREFGIHLVVLNKLVRGISEKRGHLGMGENSGFYALNLAVQFGVKRIALVGFDMNLLNGFHWHGSHKKGLSNPIDVRLAKWRKLLDEQAKPLARLGVEVVNASQTSALKAYPKVDLVEAIKQWRE